MDRKIQYHNDVTALKLVFRCNTIPLKISRVSKVTVKLDFKICREKQ